MKNNQQIKIKFNTSADTSRGVFELIQKLIVSEKINGDIQRRFMLAVGEAIDNAVIHGNKFSALRFVEVEFIFEPNKMTFTVIDEGDGFDYEKHMRVPLTEFEAPKLIEKTIKYGSPGGLGISLIRKCVNDIAFAHPGNKVTFIKYLE
ncbi:MAG: ATP-binding protein [Planctomycetota bacterium]